MKLILIILLTFFIFSCGEGIIEEEILEPEILSISKEEYFLGDTLEIEGKGFGTRSNTSFLYFVNENDTISISSLDVEFWSPVFIKLIVDFDFSAELVWIETYDKQSNNKELIIFNYPEIQTISINSGTFLQGDENGFSDERNIKSVEITRDFLVAKTELKQSIWELVMESNPSINKNVNMPVSNITWLEAVSFCNKLSKISGLDTSYIIENNVVTFDYNANGWRLPTESEWEYIANLSNIDETLISEYAWYNENSGYNPQVIANKRVDGLGLYDLYGNVWEWCWDFYSPTYDISQTIDPTGVESGERRVKRGGSYSNGKIYLRKSNRSIPSNNISSTGLRLVRNL